MLFETLEYIFEGAMIPYVLLGETARRIKAQESMDGIEEIHIGVLDWKMSDYSRRTLRDRFKGEWENKINLVDGIPVKITLIKKRYKFFENPDTVTYSAGTFLTANPFEKYWKMRNLIK